MLYIVWILYISIVIVSSIFVRGLVKNQFLKKFLFALYLSTFLSIWFSYPGESGISPAIVIFIMDFFEADNLPLMRIIRPFIFLFLVIFILDLMLSKRKSKI